MISNTGFCPLDPVKHLISFIQDLAQSINKSIQTDIRKYSREQSQERDRYHKDGDRDRMIDTNMIIVTDEY